MRVEVRWGEWKRKSLTVRFCQKWDIYFIRADVPAYQKGRATIQPVWPDDGIKSCPMFPDITQEVGKSFFTWKLYYLKIAQKGTRIFG